MNDDSLPRCSWCGGHLASARDVIERRATYADTRGGHADRHTLVVEAAERCFS